MNMHIDKTFIESVTLTYGIQHTDFASNYLLNF